MAKSVSAIVLLAVPLALRGQFAAAPSSPIATGSRPVAVAAGDFNGDGTPDLAIANAGDNTATVLLGDGTGGFRAPGAPVNLGATPASLAAWNRTGFVTSNSANDTVSVFLSNNTATAFTPAAGSPFAVGAQPVFVATADFNNDGFTDLAIANSGDRTVTLLLGVGAGGFTAAPGSPFAVGSKPVSIAVADFNGDYVPDLAIANSGDDTVTVLLGDGKGGFTAVGSPLPVGQDPVSIVAGDFNNDGKNDLAIANSGGNSVTLLLGAGDGTFAEPPGSPFAVGKAPSSLVAADFNADQLLDLAVTNAGDSTVTVLLGNDAGFAAAPYSPLTVGVAPSSVTSADFNGDGEPDLAISNSGDNTVTVLLNSYLVGVPAPRMLSAASATAPVSAGSIVAIYGGDFADAPAWAGSLPLRYEMGGVSATFRVVNIMRMPVFIGAMPLFYVSPTQINAQVPPDAAFPGCAQGSGSVYYTHVDIVTPAGGQTATISATPAPAPGLFTANQTGTGPAAAQFVTNLPDGMQSIINVAQCPPVGDCVPVPLDVTAGPSALVLWGTGISEYSTFPQGLTVTAGNQQLQVFYAGPSPQYAGLDQINVWLPASLAGSGLLNLTVTLTGTTPGLGVDCPFTMASNPVTIYIQ